MLRAVQLSARPQRACSVGQHPARRLQLARKTAAPVRHVSSRRSYTILGSQSFKEESSVPEQPRQEPSAGQQAQPPPLPPPPPQKSLAQWFTENFAVMVFSLTIIGGVWYLGGHLATKQDIWGLERATKQDIQSLDRKLEKLETRMDSRMDRLEAKMDRIESILLGGWKGQAPGAER